MILTATDHRVQADHQGQAAGARGGGGNGDGDVRAPHLHILRPHHPAVARGGHDEDYRQAGALHCILCVSAISLRSKVVPSVVLRLAGGHRLFRAFNFARCSSFHRSFEGCPAVLQENGVLTIKLPIKKSDAKNIPVESGSDDEFVAVADHDDGAAGPSSM